MKSRLSVILIIGLVVVLSACQPIPAAADSSAQYLILSTTSATVVKSQPGLFYGVQNLAGTAQANPITCYDNASAASGPVLMTATLGATQVITVNSGAGVAVKNGVTCVIATAVTAPGVAVYTN